MIVGRRVILRQRVASTMDEIERLAASGEPEGVVVVAEEQTAGRGRAGRTWRVPAGTAILCSILLRPPVPAARLTTLPLIAGVAVAEAIEMHVPVQCRLKWPNDVWIDEQKVGGILLSSRASAIGVAYVNLGIGININVPGDHLLEGATSIERVAGTAIDRRTLLTTLLARFDVAYAEFLTDGPARGLELWTKRAALLSEDVAVATTDGVVTGQFSGVDIDGALLLAHRGQVIRIVAGDLTRGPRRNPPDGRSLGRPDGGSHHHAG